jgi:hypothetical protein
MTKGRLSFPVSPKLWVTENVYEPKYVTLGDVTQGKLLILLLHAWILAQANLLPIACSSTKALGLLQQWNSGTNFVDKRRLLGRYSSLAD